MSFAAAKTWDAKHESLDSIERRIHDCESITKLRERGRNYVSNIFSFFPWLRVPHDASIVEIGPGVGYIMQAVAERYPSASITGLDIASGMIEHARSRLRRDGVPEDKFKFVHYDGVHFPFPDNSVDFFYSVAAIQHIPKPFAYNIFLEAMRCLKPTGSMAIHLLHWDSLEIEGQIPFREEVAQQIEGREGHWHHFYDRTELERVIERGLKAPYYQVSDKGVNIWAAWCKSMAALDATDATRISPEAPEWMVTAVAERDQMLRSRSWQITRPLRTISAALRKRLAR